MGKKRKEKEARAGTNTANCFLGIKITSLEEKGNRGKKESKKRVIPSEGEGARGRREKRSTLGQMRKNE